MPTEIKITEEELGLMSVFQNVTGVNSRDCIIDPAGDRIIFVVEKGLMGPAIGRGGQTIMSLERVVDRAVELVEYSDDAAEFIGNALGSRNVVDVKINSRADGHKVAIAQTSAKNKGAVLGKGGRNAERARILAQRYFDIQHIHIVTQ
ncbi:MAG: NusA-like transcription termination signal-binding factor [Nitrososphaerota archaeon]|nr:NusA-like transcription termination signal-binding factor [Nitrososphaerota archaeon]MDG6939358.1 NusA-like transcription termination signal-binding factor [Nitrososphaerota archaeon]